MLYEFDHQQLNTLRPPNTDEPTDEQLMARIRAEDESALELLARRHRGLLRTAVNRVINNDADVDDLMQEILLEIWKQASRFDEKKGKALGWIVTLARRRAIDRLRKRQAYQRAQTRLLDESKALPEPAMHPGADEDAVADDRSEILNRVISHLPDAQKQALHLAFYRGMSQREIAAHTGIPLGTIKTRMELAVRKVRTGILAIGGRSEWDLAA